MSTHATQMFQVTVRSHALPQQMMQIGQGSLMVNTILSTFTTTHNWAQTGITHLTKVAISTQKQNNYMSQNDKYHRYP